jgi:hypothetical protein
MTMRLTMGKTLFWGCGGSMVFMCAMRYRRRDVIEDLNQRRAVEKEMDENPDLKFTRAQAKDAYSSPPQ